MSSGETLALEEAVAARFSEALAVIRAERMNAERRALRIRVRDLAHEYDGGTLRMRFALDAGSFATTVLREIIVATSGDD
jgi:tRNA pseudouridine13 synthase